MELGDNLKFFNRKSRSALPGFGLDERDDFLNC